MEIETPECNRRIELMLHWVIMDEDIGGCDRTQARCSRRNDSIEHRRNNHADI